MAGVGIFCAATVLLGLAGPATAEPSDPPTTSQEAEALWKDKEHEAATAAEELSEAELASVAASAALTAATQAATEAQLAAADAQSVATAALLASDNADRTAADYRVMMDDFVSSSFDGGSPSSVTALLDADSAEDLLDRMAALDQVAADSDQTMTVALAAQDAAAEASALAATASVVAAASAETAAAAEADAATASKDAVTAQEAATAKKVQVDAAVAEFQQLYYQLSAEERAAAAAEAAAAQQQSDLLRAERTAATPADPTSEASPGTPSSSPAVPFTASGGTAIGQQAVEAALSRVGMAYVWGATGPNSFDCSGLTSWAWAQAGVTIPRTSRAQAGLQTVPLDQLQPGDLITYYSPVSHVAMYIGDGQIVHASNSRQPVLVTTVDRGGPNPTAHRVG